jgi:hypothetical protein
MATPIDLPALRRVLIPSLLALVASAAFADEPPAAPSVEVVAPAEPPPAVAPPTPPDATPLVLERRVDLRVRRVRTAPDAKAPMRAMIAAGEAFEVDGRSQPTKGCETEGWGRVAPDAWVCLDGTVVTTQAPRALPALLPFDPPLPSEAKDYLATRAWPRDPAASAVPILPFIYAKDRARFSGDDYVSLDAFLAGAPHHHVDTTRKLAFAELIDTEKGPVLRRASGHVVPLDGVWVYPVSRFHGVDLAATPAPEGTVPGWTNAPAGTAVYAAPEAAGEPAWTLPFQGQVWVTESSEHAGWLQVRDPSGTNADGWVPAKAPMHWWRDLTPPKGVDDAVWVDVDLDQNVLALRQGASVTFATMVSTGVPDHETLPGVFRMMDKAGWWDMASLPGSDEAYHVENVPWTMHFFPRFALHGAFWHDVFGSVISHGCVNLAPLDAATVFGAVHPLAYPGWWTTYATAADPGSVVRVRQGQTAPRDRR